MRRGVVAVSVWMAASSSVAHAESRVIVTCIAGACRTDVATLPLQPFSLVVRGLDDKSPAPHVRSDGKDRALKHCAADKRDYCGTVTPAEAHALWFDGRTSAITLKPSVLESLADKNEWTGSTTFSLKSDLRLSPTAEITTLRGEAEGEPPPFHPIKSPNIRTLPAPHTKTAPAPAPLNQPPGDFTAQPIPSEPPIHDVPKVTYEPLPLDDDSYPDIVAVGTVAGLECSGIAVGRRWVLTARHCGAATRVVIATNVARPALTVAVDAVTVPPDPKLDLELLHTATELPITPHARRHAGDADPPDTDLRVLGFGISDFRSFSGFGIKRAFETVGEGWGCNGNRPHTTGCDPTRELVLPAVLGHDTCNGDSGGAVLELDAQNEQWRLIGITSRAASVLDTGCGMGGIYERVDAAAPWIDDTLKGSR